MMVVFAESVSGVGLDSKTAGRGPVRSKLIAVMLAALLGCGASACAADWQWPSQMTVAGFEITNIRGSADPDGSGRASGTINIPGTQNQTISLTRSPRGEVTGRSSVKLRLSGAEVGGDFTLNASGLKGSGIVQVFLGSVNDCSMTIHPDGRIEGSGKLALGGLNAAVRVSVTRHSLELNGSTPARAQAEKPLADYSFKGMLILGAQSGKMNITAEGRVVRQGKLSGEVSEYAVSGIGVDPGNGRATVNVGGVTVTFDFF